MDAAIWSQVYDPLGAAVLSTAVAAVPLVLLLGLLAFGGFSALRAALAALLAAIGLATAVFGMPPAAAGAAAAYGAAFGLFPIGWIVINVMFLHALSVESGGLDVMKRSVTRLSPDHRVQALLIAFAFGAFLEGAAGFGAPVAITAALLAGTGFPALEAAVIALIANTAPVAFGALGTPIITLAKVTGLDEASIAAVAGRQLPIFSLVIPAWMVVAMSGWRGLAGVWPAVLVCGVSFAAVQFAMANFVGAALVDVVGGIACLAVMAVFLRAWRPATIWRHDGPGDALVTAEADSAARVAWAWMPWLILSACVFLWGLGPVKAALDAALPPPEIRVPALHERVAKVPPATRAEMEVEPAVYRFNVASAAGTGILAAAVLAVPWLGIGWRRALRLWWVNLARLAMPLATIATMLALAFVTRYSGMDVTLGLALTGTGLAYPFFAAILGWLGVAITGSDTSSNAMFGSLQKVTAEQLGLDPLLICTANSTGGVMGKMIDAQSIVVAAAATGVHRQEGVILRRVFPHSAALAALVGLLVWLQAGPLAWMVRLPPRPAVNSGSSTIHHPEGGAR
jgi:lactate permease